MLELKKIVVVLIMSLFSFSILPLVSSEVSANGQPRILYVNADGSTGFRTIQEAVTNASYGDTIFVYSGIYNESVEIDRSLSLVGEGRDSTIIDGQNPDFVISMKTDNISISGFTIRKSYANASSAGIRMSSNSTISHNRVENTHLGVYLYGSMNDVILDNVISENDAYGISVYFSNKNVFSRNSILNNREGLYIYQSKNNTFTDNLISNNTEGMSLYSTSDNNLFSGNTFIDNQDVGGYISYYCNHNIFYHNNFRDNIRVEPGSVNVWTYGGEGNYWRDYTGEDSNDDGIGNSIYSIGPNIRDNSPLVGMFSEFEISSPTNTYTVTIISNSTVSDFKFEIGAETGNKIMRFNVAGPVGSAGFSRVSIPSGLMNYSLIVFGGEEEIVPTVLDISSSANVFLYFTYSHSEQTVAIISSQNLNLYSDLLDENSRLRRDLDSLNATYLGILEGFTDFLNKYSQLQQDYLGLNESYYEHLTAYQEDLQNFRNLTYMFAASTAIFIVTTVYLSRRLHTNLPKSTGDKK